MERICALALCLLLSLCSARSPPKIPFLNPLNCNETNAQVELATDLINEDREEGFIIKPVRIRSIFEQKNVLNNTKVHAATHKTTRQNTQLDNVPGGSLYYIDFEVQETKCSVLSDKKWKDCSEEPQFHEKVNGKCKCILYIARPWRILKIIHYNCTLGTVPSSSIVMRCPDCPVAVSSITPTIKAKAGNLAENFNQQDNNQTHHFKVDNIERVRTQWMFAQSFFMQFTIKETDCLKTQENVVLENCNFVEDQKAHVGFCTGSVYNTPEKKEGHQVTCEIYNPKYDDDHQNRRGPCEHAKEGAQAEEVKDNVEAAAGEGGTGEAGQGEDLPEKCELGKGKHCGRQRGHRHHCHPGHRHPHHPGHHHPGHRHHHHPGHHHHGHHHHHPDNRHDHQNHSHPHDPAHHHHNHTSAEHGSSSEETTDKQHFKRTKGSVTVYYLDGETPTPPVPTILRLPTPGKRMLDIADFPNEPSPLKTCPSPP